MTSEIPLTEPPADRGRLHDLICRIECGDYFLLLLGGIILLLVSQKVVMNRPKIQRWGLRLGVLAFIGWYIRDIVLKGFWGAEQFAFVGFRALLVLLYVSTVSWLLLAVVSCVADEILGRVRQRFAGRWRRIQGRFRQRIERRQQARARNQQRDRTPNPFSNSEQVQKRAEEQARLTQQREAAALAQRQREDTRYDVELLYDRYRAELADKLPPQRLAEYFDQYLTDSLTAEAYSNRADQLKQMIRDRADVKQGVQLPEFESIEQIIEHYRTKKQRLKFLDLDEDTLETLEVTLDEIQDREVRKFLT